MKPALLTLLLATGFATTVAKADLFDSRPDLRVCAVGMLAGFGNGLEERACAKYFDLPSNYHFACARGVVRGFKTSMDRKACVFFFEGQMEAAKTAYVKPSGR